jgi:pimeloyl-ACP methyl ester carboxylesterase
MWCSDSITVDGIKLAYRTVAPSEPKDPPQQILLLHGLGSNSYAFRGNLQLFADAGYQGFAVDWVGHGASDVVSVGFGSIAHAEGMSNYQTFSPGHRSVQAHHHLAARHGLMMQSDTTCQFVLMFGLVFVVAVIWVAHML